MGRTYKATGINLKGMPLGESDRLLVILTREYGLIRAVAPGARKHHSGLSGRSGLFVVNELLIASGRSLDKITQAETIESYPGLSQDLGKLAASQYLAEMVLAQALSEQPQEELFCLLNEHLSRLERLPNQSASLVLAHLTHAVFHLLALAGVTPQVQVCCLTQLPLSPDFTDPDWRVGFSVTAGGTVSLSALGRLEAKGHLPSGKQQSNSPPQRSTTYTVGTTRGSTSFKDNAVAEAGIGYQTINHRQEKPVLSTRLNAIELSLLQQLAGASLPQLVAALPSQQSSLDTSWRFVEQILRQYVQYYFGRPIRSATLIDSYFASLPTHSTNHDATV
ncbi:MAG: DNA repair protein RecO [Chroococcidiopsidaceae cyanobacterium CP_BM_RX_35]|nr:DNA repair protein RecO [Chroococcidiopsidaceae cyanobacterium CP_BM_RX_35]